MSQTGSSPNSTRGPDLFNSVVLRIAAQVGCLTLVVILAALIMGLLLDRVLDTRPLFTILLMVASMPMTWAAIFWIVNRSKKQIMEQPRITNRPKEQWEEEDSDKD